MHSTSQVFLNGKILVPKSEFDVSFARSSGAGGQNVNKVNSKAVVRWNIQNTTSVPHDVKTRFFERFQSKILDSGEIIITSETHRDQHKNLQECFNKIDDMLDQVFLPPKKRLPTKPTKASKHATKRSQEKLREKKQNRKKLRARDYE